jgi:predicted CXXCH cytochrome family protein
MKVLNALGVAVLVVIIVIVALGALMIKRGFRANAMPPSWEATLARKMRNLAIPRGQRWQKNPFSTPSDLAQARDFFLTRCANCHGVDGSGKTPLGLNLYPRVPDLRSDATQNLTDGELHFIIENGIQLTGMPAWGTPHEQPSGNSWKLVLYIRNLSSIQRNDRSQQRNASASAHYVGSESCRKCHEEIYESWKKTPMANVVRDPREDPDAILPDLATNGVASFTKDHVAFVYGSLWKQRYFTKIGDDYFPLGAQWDIGNRTWRPYMVPVKGGDWWGALYPPDNLQRPTGPTCDGCHSVGYDIHTKQVSEWNVGCERCHGPGSEHAMRPSRDNILNPGQMDPVAANDTCIQCHSQGQPLSNPIEGKYYDWPVGYNVDLRLQDFWRLEDCALGQTTFYYFPDCTAHKNRMQGNDFAQSVMYKHGVTCSSCHDVHGTTNYAQLRKPANQICLDCHGPSTPNGPRTAALEAHTHHKNGSTGSECVACHMQAIETEGVPGTFVHAHTFRFIPPEATEKYGIPNPCTSCHKEKPTAWAREAMSQWRDYAPWQPGR